MSEYRKDLNGKQATIRAGYSPKSAAFRAPRLLSDPDVAAAIRAGRDRVLQANEVTVDRTVAEMACIAFFDPAAMFDQKGKLLPIPEMPEEARRAIVGVEYEELFVWRNGRKKSIGNLRKVRVANKLGALETLAKYLSMFKGRVDLTRREERPRMSILEARALAGLEAFDEQIRRESQSAALPEG